MKKLLAVALLTVATLAGCGTTPMPTAVRAGQALQARDVESDKALGDRVAKISGFKGEVLEVKPGMDEGVLVVTLKAAKGAKNGGTFSAEYLPHLETGMPFLDLQAGTVISADVSYALVARNKTKDILKAGTISHLKLVKAAK